MFVLRAKAKLSDASEAYALFGLVGSAVPPALPPALWSQWRDGEASVVRLYPAEGLAASAVDGARGKPSTGRRRPVEHALWQWREVRSGVATLSQPIFEAFVPQMLNYESVGGVNFKKGCYPGPGSGGAQPVPRHAQAPRLRRARATPMAAGQEVFHDGDAEQPCGIVAQAAAAPGGGFDAIVSLQTSAAAQGSLHAGGPDGPALQLLPLPYPLLDDI